MGNKPSEPVTQVDSKLVSTKDARFFKLSAHDIPVPKMNIVILVVGTRGDVQPFVYLGQALKRHGHRVRLATHAEYREDVTTKGGLEFYPLGGDPRKLSEYMVKTGGRLVPNLFNSEERNVLPEKMQMLKEITFSTYPACTEPDPLDPSHTDFDADAIISNPVTYGHIHIAEKLSVPLHIMFPQPWSPTMAFPHPLSNFSMTSPDTSQNYYSFKMVDEFMWIGLGGMTNEFRKSMGLKEICTGQGGDALLNDNKVPISHMWSPFFVPKCSDWPAHVDVVGEYRLLGGQISSYTPAPALADFLAGDEKPIYIGFGSMVIEDSTKLVQIIKEAAAAVKCKIILQSGWTTYAEPNTKISDEIMVVGPMPHDWLFNVVCGVIHHGGAGTTSAGLRAGNPTFICPFFGDQHFWAEMVYRSKAGPRGIPVNNLTTKTLSEALRVMRAPETIAQAKEMGAKMSAEDGVSEGVKSFYRQLPKSNMICEVSIFVEGSEEVLVKEKSRVARCYCPKCGFKMSSEIERIIHRKGGRYEQHEPVFYGPSQWGVVESTGMFSSKKENRKAVTADSKLVQTLLCTSASIFRADEEASAETIFGEEEILRAEAALAKAKTFMEIWKKFDHSRDRSVESTELLKLMPKEDVDDLTKSCDVNGDGVLTFTELAWQFSFAPQDAADRLRQAAGIRE